MEGYRKGSVNVGKFTDLSCELFNLEKKPKGDYVIAHENGNTVVLDVTLDDELIMEGEYREFVRGLQVLRKEADFLIEDRIVASFETSDEHLKAVLDKFKNKIMQEVLIKEIKPSLSNPVITKDVEMGDGSVRVSLAK